MPGLINFAYGSNMLARRLEQRVPGARRLGRAVLEGYQLRWHKLGNDGSGKCDVVATAGVDDLVHGVLYEIAAGADKAALDRAEGLGAGYDETIVAVEAEQGMLQAHLYVATRIDPTCLPFTWYKALVVAGARENALPRAYVERLAATPAVDDADLARHGLHLALAAG